jgi:hypothetical protein
MTGKKMYQVWFDQSDFDELKQFADREGVPMSTVVRAGTKHYMEVYTKAFGSFLEEPEEEDIDVITEGDGEE